MKAHMHMPGWMHLHKPNWHTLGIRIDHVVHDPRFWASIALTILLVLMILTMIFGQSGGGKNTTPPVYPFHPYMP